MHLSILDGRNVSSTLQKLHYFLAAPRHCCPTRFRLGQILQMQEAEVTLARNDFVTLNGLGATYPRPPKANSETKKVVVKA
jgi:hypothetical protein